MEEQGLVFRLPESAKDALHGRVVYRPSSDRYVHVLDSKLSHQPRLIYRPRLHWVTKVEHNFPPGRFEGAQLCLGRLTPGDDAGQDLTGVRDTADCFEGGSHIHREIQLCGWNRRTCRARRSPT